MELSKQKNIDRLSGQLPQYEREAIADIIDLGSVVCIYIIHVDS